MRVFIDGELWDLRYWCYNSWLSSKLLKFGLDISESSRNTESARKNSVGSIKHLSLSSGYLSELICYRDILESLGLINLSSIVLDSVELGFFVWTVILRQIIDSHATFRRHNRSTVTNIGDIAFSFNCENNNGARPWLIKSGALISNFQKPFFRYPAPIFKCFYGISWKTGLSYDNLV